MPKCPTCGRSFRKCTTSSGGTPLPKEEAQELITYFTDQTEGEHGFTPETGSDDWVAANRELKKRDKQELKHIITWFIHSKKAKEVGLSLSIALSKHSINMYYMEGASGGRGEEIRRTLGVSERGRQKAERSTRHSATRGICPEKIITGRHDIVEPETGTVPAEGLGKGSGLHREIFK